MPERRVSVGIDVGGTFAKLAAVSASGRILAEGQIPTGAGERPAAFVRRVSGSLESWLAERGLRAKAVGLGLAGDVDSEAGRLRLAPNLKSWEGFGFRAAFSRRLGLPVVVDNDANLAVWGGYCLRLKRRPKTVVGLTLGTGVGGGIVIDGRLHRGATGSAGEVGHTIVESGGERCHCGRRGCLEAYAGSYGILRTARRLLAESRKPSALSEVEGLDTAALAAAAGRGDPIARRVWGETAERLSVGLSNLVLVLNPEVVLLLGGVSRAGRWLLDPLRRALARSPFKTPFGAVELVAAGDRHWGSIGAALLAAEPADARR